MTRKLAVSVFAISLAVIGCGSDDGTPTKNDAGPDAVVKLDTSSADVLVKLDVNKLDVSASDVAASDASGSDAISTPSDSGADVIATPDVVVTPDAVPGADAVVDAPSSDVPVNTDGPMTADSGSDAESNG